MSQFSFDLRELLLMRLREEEQNKEFYYKIGFHTGPGGNRDGIGDYWKILDSAGIPAIHISVDDYGPCYELDLLAKISGVPHVNMYRIHVKIPHFNADVPRYELTPEVAADIWWRTIRAHLPPEMISGTVRDRVWLIAGNELDKNRASWIGYWALAVAKFANNDGFKIAAFGWSSGEPDYDDWEAPGMAEYLIYCSEHPDEAAIATHEYSYTLDLNDGIGYLVGRFDFINDACYTLGIKTPKIFITEFGWTYQTIPSSVTAMVQMLSVASLYANHPEVRGAMTWYLGGGFGEIANQVQKLIVPVTDVSLSWGYSPGPIEPPLPPLEGDIMDLGLFFVPEPTRLHGPIYMIYNNWGQGPERTHLARSPRGSDFHHYVSKNDRWERRYIHEHWIWLQADTSRGDNEFYTVHGDPWLPRFMIPGQSYTRNEETKIYSLDSCKQIDAGGMVSDIDFLGPNTEKAIAISAEFGIEVVELHWIVNDQLEEKYFYGKHVGLVAWENRFGLKSEIKEFVPSSEQPNTIGWSCAVLDERAPVYIPSPPKPPLPTAPYQEAWDKTVEMQVTGVGGIRLNKNAGIQQQMNRDNQTGLYLQKVTDEVIIDGYTFMAAESLTGACSRRVYVWSPDKAVYHFNDPG